MGLLYLIPPPRDFNPQWVGAWREWKTLRVGGFPNRLYTAPSGSPRSLEREQDGKLTKCVCGGGGFEYLVSGTIAKWRLVTPYVYEIEVWWKLRCNSSQLKSISCVSTTRALHYLHSRISVNERNSLNSPQYQPHLVFILQLLFPRRSSLSQSPNVNYWDSWLHGIFDMSKRYLW